MKRWILAALMASAALAHAQPSASKKELIAKLIELHKPAIENMSRQIAERPVMQLLQQAGGAVRHEVPADKRDATVKALQDEAKSFVDDAVPIVTERAMKIAPQALGAVFEQKFTEDELKQIIAWLQSPVNKKYQSIGPELMQTMTQKVIADASPALDPKLKSLQIKMSETLKSAMPPASSPKPGAAAPAAKPASH